MSESKGNKLASKESHFSTYKRLMRIMDYEADFVPTRAMIKYNQYRSFV